MDVAALLASLTAVAASAEANPLPYLRWTPPQERFYRLRAPRKAFRAGNQLGKTYAGLRWTIDLAAGRHPDQFRPPPLECWIVCTTMSQSVAIMRKFHDLIEASIVDDDASSNFSVKDGYGRNNPTVILSNGSVIRFKTTGQGATAFQGATIHAVLIDEPTDLDIYRELDRRLLRTGGLLGITFTPVNRDCSWLRELTEAGIVEEVHAKLTVENLTPIGSDEPLSLMDGTRMDADWIASQWRSTPSVFARVILDGEWDAAPEGVFFDCFDRERHVSASFRLSGAGSPAKWVLGLDHATAGREYGQVAVLAQVQQFRDEDGRTREAVLVVGEVVMKGTATEDQVAERVVGMLAQVGVRWRDLKEVWGDKPAWNAWTMKSNRRLFAAIARELGVPSQSLTPGIGGVKEGRGGGQGSVDAGCRYLYEAIADNLVIVHPRCKLLIDALTTWDYGKTHEAKDRIDALRYALRGYIAPRVIQTGGVRFG